MQLLGKRIEEHVELVKTREAEVQIRMQDRKLDDDGDDANVTQAIMEIKKQQTVLEKDKIVSGRIYAQVKSKRTGQKIGDVITSSNSKAWVGMPKSIVGKINQTIGDVKTNGGSVAYVGVMNDDMKM